MSRVSTRAGVTAYFTNAAAAGDLPYVGTVYPARPSILEEVAYEQTMLGAAVELTDNGSSAVMVVNLPSDKRRRQADTGRGAVNDTLVHDVALEIFFANLGANQTSAVDQGIPAQQDYDAIIDTIVDLIRADATLGGISWSAGEYTSGIDHRQTQPYTDADGMIIFIVGSVSFQSYDWYAGNVYPPS